MFVVEYLNRIGLLSISVDFKHKLQDITNISLHNNHTLIIGTRVDQSKIALPTEVKHGQIQIKKVDLKNGCLTLTINIKDSQSGEAGAETEPFVNSSVSRWSCRDLKQKTSKNVENKNQFSFKCAECSSDVIESNDYGFLDTPSEYWYEMMDFWHCHKPHSNGTHDNTKKYDGRLRPKRNEIIVGNHYLLIGESDNSCQLFSCSDQSVLCARCNTVLGDFEDGVMKIYKWNLTLTYSDREERFPMHLYVHNLLIDKVNLAATRKFKLFDSRNHKWVYIWVLNVDMNVSIKDNISNRAIKLLHYQTDDAEDFHLREDATEMIQVPESVKESFIQEMRRTNSLLPRNMQTLTMQEDKTHQTYLLSYLVAE